MTTVDRILSICKEKKIPISKLEKDCGFANGYIKQLRKGTLPNDRLAVVADYLGVTAEYLTTGENADGYYYDKQTAELAQEIYQNPELHMLLDAARDESAEDIRNFYQMILLMKKREKRED